MYDNATQYKRGAPFGVGFGCLPQPLQERNALKWIAKSISVWMCTGKHFDCGDEWCRKDRDGMRHRDESQHDSAVFDGCAETCTSRLKKEPRLPGCTTC